jgi:hypothetical protein
MAMRTNAQNDRESVCRISFSSSSTGTATAA